MRIVILLWTCWLLTSCWWGKDNESDYKKVSLRREVSEVQLPVALWDYIESQYDKVIIDGKVVDENPYKGMQAIIDQKKVPKALKHMSFKVFLKEFHSGVLGRENLMLEFAPGGGDLDLQKFVDPRGGSFYFKIALDMPVEENDFLHVSYLGRGRQRKIGNQIYGSGCEKYFDVTRYFRETLSQKGALISTKNKTHVTVLAGTYIMFLKKRDVRHIAQLTVKDSRYKSLQCETPASRESL